MAGPLVAVPNIFVNGTVAQAPDVNADFQNLVDQVNSLWNANFTSGILNPASGGTGGGGLTAHQLVLGGGGGAAFTSLAPGNAGQVLTSAGAGVDPAFTTPAATAMTLLQTASASGTTTIPFTAISTAYKHFMLQGTGIITASSAVLGLQVGEGVTPTWETAASYRYAGVFIDDIGAGSLNTFGTATATDITLTLNAIGGASISSGTFTVWFTNLASTTQYKSFSMKSSWVDSGARAANWDGSGHWSGDTNAITAVRLIAGANITAGEFSLYGISS